MTQHDLLKEATDPATDPERLRELAQMMSEAVRRAVSKNPSVPEDVWGDALLQGWPEAWDNPMAPIYILTWTPREDNPDTLEDAIQVSTFALWKHPERCSLEGKALLNAKLQEWWATSEEADDMMNFLGRWVKEENGGSQEHREVVRVLVLCVRTTPDLTDDDRQALDLLEVWCAGGKDQRKEAYALASSQPVKYAYWSAINPFNMGSTLSQVFRGVAWTKEAKAEHERLRADLIRREMPLPPVVA
jgi:hypothetical protein